ncbi:MAG: phosphatidate cytidylyltransferase [Chloroflexi bacterium]|nr:phosphatidate cytidylyltransferase [Chloroflexota bacterium]
MLNNNLLALVNTFAAALIWLRLNNYAAERGWIEAQMSRKIIHMGTGPIFVLTWLLFDNSPSSRYLAALVPLAITAQFALVGLGVIKDEAAVKAMSRTGDRREILKGPLYYGIVFIIITIVFWLDNPVGIIALMLLCGGDGLAEIVGTRWGRFHLPWAPDKTLLGTLAMFAGGWSFALIMTNIFTSLNVFPGEFRDYIFPINLISVAGAAVESLRLKDIDNLTVTTAAVLYGNLLFHPDIWPPQL